MYRFVCIFVSSAILQNYSVGLSVSCNRNHVLCTADGKKSGESCFLMTPKPLTYDDAHQACRRLGAKMAAPRSDQENDFLASLVQGRAVWVACTDRRQEGWWECEGSEDDQGVFIKWGNGEPNNAGVDEHCAAIVSSGEWFDNYCSDELLAVCRQQTRAHCFTTNLEGRLAEDACL